MNPESKKLQHQQQSEEVSQHQQSQLGTVLEFGSAEDVLRHDAAQTQVPAGVEDRLARSLKREPATGTSWWRRFFGQ